MTSEDYRRYLGNQFILYRKQLLFINESCEFYKATNNKTALDADADKMLVQADCRTTLPRGY